MMGIFTKFSSDEIAAAKARLQERMDQRKLERDIREAVVMVQRRRYLDSIPEAQFEPIRKTDRM